MIRFSHEWDATDGGSWAMLLGMVHVPMFGVRKAPKAAEEAAILLDGSRGSFAFLRTEDTSFAETMEPLSWSWSSCVRHMVTVVPSRKRMYVRRWDEPQTISTFEVPSQGVGAFSLLEQIEAAGEPRRPNAVRHVLEPFRQIRLRIGARDPLLAVQLLNGLLLVAEVAQKPARRNDVEAIRTFSDALKELSDKERELCGLVDIPRAVAALNAMDLVRSMVAPDPYTGCRLHPTLLFRHAANQLYQEAHLEIERNPQGYLPGLEPTAEPVSGVSPRDVRFTPPNLARALVQKALEVIADQRSSLTILDPACGSGIFLVETIRELSANSRREHKIKAVGYDISSISEYTTRFRLKYATHNAIPSRAVRTEVTRRDSLDGPWVNADIILMNPPFIPWERLSPAQRQKVSDELGDTAQQRPDIAMAFVSKAVRSLRPGGVLGCVLPASLLSSQTGLPWRRWLGEQGSLQVLGCFEGYKYFPTSLVETAFLIYQKHGEQVGKSRAVEILISEEGSEDAALRALRLGSEAVLSLRGVERFTRPRQALSPKSWRPLRQDAYKKRDHIAALALPRIGDLFKIRQGVRTGHAVFVLRASQYKELGRKEIEFFRPAAGGGSIRNAQLWPTEYVFYPYATDGSLLLTSEDELKDNLPTYYEAYLAPVKQTLKSRPRFSTRKWWELSWQRAWQAAPAPRLLSTYFGESGSFAFDEGGQYVVVNGHAWHWVKETLALSKSTRVPFEHTPAVWAYLAILNSQVFEEIMSLFSVRLQGGQIRLEPRFLSQIPLPDVTDEMNCPAGVVKELVTLGKTIHAGNLASVAPDLNKHVSRLYGLGQE
jgi:adenine-specific DNA-methyltransferase